MNDDAIGDELDQRLGRTATVARNDLAHEEATGPQLQFPRALRRVIARGIAIERDEPTGGGEARVDTLLRHYTDVMPRMRVAQLDPAQPDATYFHTPLDWNRLPRLAAAIDRLYAVLGEAGVAGTPALGAASGEAFRARAPTLATLYSRTHYGGLMPLLYGYPADLAYFTRRAAEAGLDTHATIDRYLTAPIVHELCHFARDRVAIAPPHLDECIAGWLGVHVHAAFAYPALGHDDAIYATPWLAQVGQAIARAFGVDAVVRAHAGAARWSETLPEDFVETATRLGWDDWRARRTLHFLSDTFDPAPWVALALAGGANRSLAGATLANLAAIPPCSLASGLSDDPDFDRSIVSDALRAMCLENAQIDGSFRATTRLPDGAIEIDAIACRVTASRRGEVDHVAPSYWLPPAVGARLVANGLAGYQVQLATVEAIPQAARAVCDASHGVEHDGFAVVPRFA